MIPAAERHEPRSEPGPSLAPLSTTDADGTPAAEIDKSQNVAIAKPSAGERYRIVLGDGCGVCRAASYISFTADRMPQIPVAGCHDPGGCRCSLPLRSGVITSVPSEGVTSGFTARRAEPSVPVIYDQLSGALSRAAFDVFGTVLVSETMRRGASLGLLLVGLDPSPHSGAEPQSTVEAQLRELAGVLRRLLRTSDLIARHGTRSFALLLAGTDHTGSLRVAQRIQTSINAHPATETRLAKATVSQGLAVLPDGGTDLAELLTRAERFMARAIADGGDRINTHQAVGGKSDADQSVPVRASAAQGRAPVSVLLNPMDEEAALDVPSEWLDAALFGADEKRKCEPRQLAEYLDRFPLVPSAVDIDLMPDEVAYLSRRAQRGWDSMPASSRPAGAVLLPMQGSLAEWLRSGHQTPHLPIGAVPFWDSGSLCLTNCRLLFRKRGTVESVLLSDVRSLEYLDRGLACSIGRDGKRLLLMLPDALQVGLCVARALQDSRRMALAGSA